MATEDNNEILMAWLFKKGIKKTNRLHHRFADGTEVARLLKNIYPSLVEIYNYSPCDRLNSKIYNWETLNKRVLKKLNLAQTKEQLVEYARGRPGAINTLLWQILHLESKKNIPIEKPAPKYNSKDAHWQYENILRQMSNSASASANAEPQNEDDLFWNTLTWQQAE